MPRILHNVRQCQRLTIHCQLFFAFVDHNIIQHTICAVNPGGALGDSVVYLLGDRDLYLLRVLNGVAIGFVIHLDRCLVGQVKLGSCTFGILGKVDLAKI